MVDPSIDDFEELLSLLEDTRARLGRMETRVQKLTRILKQNDLEEEEGDEDEYEL